MYSYAMRSLGSAIRTTALTSRKNTRGQTSVWSWPRNLCVAMKADIERHMTVEKHTTTQTQKHRLWEQMPLVSMENISLVGTDRVRNSRQYVL